MQLVRRELAKTCRDKGFDIDKVMIIRVDRGKRDIAQAPHRQLQRGSAARRRAATLPEFKMRPDRRHELK